MADGLNSAFKGLKKVNKLPTTSTDLRYIATEKNHCLNEEPHKDS